MRQFILLHIIEKIDFPVLFLSELMLQCNENLVMRSRIHQQYTSICDQENVTQAVIVRFLVHPMIPTTT